MVYIVISNPDGETTKEAIEHIRKMYGNKVLANSFLRDFFMNTGESNLAQMVDIMFEIMTEEQRKSWLGSSDAYRIIKGEVDLTVPTYRGTKTQG
ncbi:hypothetical protein J4234_03985 [Candidatus Woesearchaeota archaeon]|nr:hypothetical protein [Candidatus Woesearchaeota archaeon]